ncbi:hypothetical protein [Mobilicoccus massiliensis]|uniref:hypothetical protein n=1 Tax=Mobilicoccus massiliensis TaxID=1522310 RepID=UPI0011424427|nr:hypothetical protein [Mobilicoccus massiliensis]
MTSTHDSAVDAVVRAASALDEAEFAAYGGGWPDEVGTALVDAVYSIRARYHSTEPGSGVYGRVVELRRLHPEVTNDLRALVELGSDRLAETMGRGKTASRRKSECIMEAAEALLALDPPVCTATDLLAADPADVKRAYTGVHGLGWVTCEYFQMLLGVFGVKADTMIVRFVNAALASADLPSVTAEEARRLVIDAHRADSRGATLTQYEHALWRAKGNLAEA